MTEDDELMQMAYLDFEVNLRAQSIQMGLLRQSTTATGSSTTSIQAAMERGYLDGLPLKEIWRLRQSSMTEPSQG